MSCDACNDSRDSHEILMRAQVVVSQKSMSPSCHVTCGMHAKQRPAALTSSASGHAYIYWHWTVSLGFGIARRECKNTRATSMTSMVESSEGVLFETLTSSPAGLLVAKTDGGRFG